jgi:ABC-2 type transport system permease protein
MAGVRILLHRELLESWRTLRLPVVGGLFLVVGLTSPLLAKFLPEIVRAAGGDQLKGVQLPAPVVGDAVLQMWKNLAQFGAFSAIILAMGSVAIERDRGTAAFVLSKTVSRGAFLTAKVAAIAFVLAVAVALAVAAGWVYTAILFEPMPIAGWLGLASLAWLGLTPWAALTFLGSTVTGSVAAAAGIGFIAWLGLSIASAVPNAASFLPGGLEGPAVSLADGSTIDAAAVLTPALSTLVLVTIALLIAGWSFRRQEL